MKYYEILYIINPNYEQDRLSKAMDSVTEELKKSKVEIINHRIWGKKRLAYMIQNHKYGTYVILEYGSEETGLMPDFNLFMKLNKAVLRTQTIRLDEKPEEYKEDEVPEIVAGKKPEEVKINKPEPVIEVAPDPIEEKASDEVIEKSEKVEQEQTEQTEKTEEKVEKIEKVEEAPTDEKTSDEDEEKVEKEN
ncbi:30S ribosomal protein S6 [Candidatus Neomarinimicrobiota bacterium]